MTAHRLLAKIAPLACSLAALIALPALAQTTVQDAWVRGTVAEQTVTGAFFNIRSAQGGKLLSVSSPAAAVVEIHAMKMDGSTMRMRAINELDLPAGKAVEFKPGGYHVMLVGLKTPLGTGQSVDLTLVVEAADGKKETLLVQAPVRALGAVPTEHKH
jgi:copper(I)-binding protein